MTDPGVPGPGPGRTAPAPVPDRPRLPVRSQLLAAAGAAVIAGTYAWILLTQPATLGTGLGPTTLGVLAGYLSGTALVIAAALPLLTSRVLLLVPIAIAVNIAAGQLVGVSGLPLYLDTLGIVLVGMLAGPLAGAATGALSNLVWGLTLNPTVIPFAAGAAAVGALAGLVTRWGLVRRAATAIPAGAVTGLVAGVLAAPVAAYVFGGGLGVGTGSVVALLQATGQSMLGATTVQSLLSDPLDKAISFALVWAALRAAPRSAVAGLPIPRRLLPGGHA